MKPIYMIILLVLMAGCTIKEESAEEITFSCENLITKEKMTELTGQEILEIKERIVNAPGVQENTWIVCSGKGTNGNYVFEFDVRSYESEERLYAYYDHLKEGYSDKSTEIIYEELDTKTAYIPKPVAPRLFRIDRTNPLFLITISPGWGMDKELMETFARYIDDKI